MIPSVLRKLASNYLAPLFSGAELGHRTLLSTSRQDRVAFKGPCEIQFKATRTDRYRLKLRRSQQFEQSGTNRITERDVVEAFVQVVGQLPSRMDSLHANDLRLNMQRRIIAEAMPRPTARVIVLQVIDQMTDWATRLYEGKPITAAIGIMPRSSHGGVRLRTMCQEEFSSVLSNGFDTVFICDSRGKVVAHESLPHPKINKIPSFAPYREAAIAAWARSGRVALVLNRLGEIMIFSNRELAFTRRSGKWHFLTHGPVIRQMGYLNSQVRRAVYESCLDASFARTGACIGVVLSQHMSKWKQIATSKEDHLASISSTKTKTIKKMVGGRPFRNLDRRFRQELLAIDGATLMDHQGNILAVGAILKIRGGSTGGGVLPPLRHSANLGLASKSRKTAESGGSIKEARNRNSL